MGAFRALTVADVRNVQRDSLLKFLIFYPWLLGLAMRFLIPWVAASLAGTYDLTPYYPLLTGFFGILITPLLAGFVTGFLLLDERDDHTLTALQVTPLSMNRYLTYRLLAPMVIALASTFHRHSADERSTCPCLSCCPFHWSLRWAPIFTLIPGHGGRQQSPGLRRDEGLGVFFLAPFAVWFIPEPWQWLIGVFPTLLARQGLPGSCWTAATGGRTWGWGCW
ncbi:MAG: hypothetical protein R2838_18480 [Caldilineaceae bacterium]